MAKLKAGDVVRLKSGGPRMTVGGASARSVFLSCYWFVGGEIKRQDLPPEDNDEWQDAEPA